MRESSNLDTASNLDNHLIGYERLLALFKSIQKQTPKGVGLKREVRSSATYVALEFKIGNKRTSKACNCEFTEIGIVGVAELRYEIEKVKI